LKILSATRALRRTVLFAAVAAGLTLAAQPASAAIMLMTRTLKIAGVQGGQNAADLIGTNLVLKVTYDTEEGLTEDTRHPEFGGNYALSNNGGATMPMLSASYTLGEDTFDASDAGGFFVTFFNYFPGFQTQHNVTFAGVSDGRVYDISLSARLLEGETLPADFTQPLERAVTGYGLFNFNHGERQGTLVFNDTDLGSLKIEHAAVPEPATWALMITGFGLAGATLRRRRPATA